MIKLGKYLALLLLLGGALGTTLFLVFNNDSNENDYVNVISDALSVNEGELFDLAIDSNLDLSALNIVSSNLSTVRLEGSQLKALRGGTVTLTVESQDGRVQDQVLITVNPLVSEVPLEDTSFEVVLGNERFTFSEPIPVSQLDAPLREGYTFMGFSLQENGEVLESDAVIDESLTLYSIYEAIEEETPEPPVVDEGDSEDEDEVDEDSEAPVDEDDETITVSTPSSITVTLENDQGITMSVLTVSPGSIISAGAFDGELSEVGYFLKGETCENPFDFDTPLVTDTSIVFGETNYTSPCIELDEMATLGKLQVGETIEAFVSPSAANISYEWFISANDRDYSLLSNVTGSTLELAPEHFRQYIAVKLTGTGDYTGSLSLPLGRVGLSSQTVGSGDSGDSGGSSCTTFTEINTTNEFLNMTSNGCYKLTDDIDLSGQGLLTQSALNITFTGILDGDGYAISRLSINSTGTNRVGLFTNLIDSTVENLTLSAFNITGGKHVGGIAGYADNSIITNINLMSSNIKGSGDPENYSQNYVGGLIGRTFYSEFENIQVTNVTVGGVDYYVGGLVGYAVRGPEINNAQLKNVNVFGENEIGGIVGHSSESEITNSSFNGTVSGKSNVGGLSGFFGYGSTIETSFNTGLVIATGDNAGGLVGSMRSGVNIANEIISSYNTGNVSSSAAKVGGLVGWVYTDVSSAETSSSITNSYSVANITGSSKVGTIVGFVDSNNSNDYAALSFTKIFWNTDIGSVSSGIGDTGTNTATTGSITGITSGAMRDINTFSNAPWDINAHDDTTGRWTIGYEGASTFPWLSWQIEPEDANTLSLLSLGYIPIASLEDFEAISSEDSGHTFAAGTVYQLVTDAALNKNYVIINDINLSGHTSNNSVINDTFTGNISGMSFTLSNLIIENTTADRFGLIKALDGAAIENVLLKDFTITGRSVIGSLAGEIIETSAPVRISNIHMQEISLNGTLGPTMLGGLIGKIDNSGNSNLVTIENISFEGDINGERDIGGFVGYLESAQVLFDSLDFSGNINVTGNSFSRAGGVIGHLNGNNSEANSITMIGIIGAGVINTFGVEVGGLIGGSNDYNIYINDALTDFTINAHDDYTGGFIGEYSNSSVQANPINYNITISNSHNQGNIDSAGDYTGGLIGSYETRYEDTRVNIYSTTQSGDISGHNQVGGYIGHAERYVNIINATQSGTIARYSDTVLDHGIGGLIGFLDKLTSKIVISNVSISGDVGDILEDNVGGLVGHAFNNYNPSDPQNITINSINLTGDIKGDYYVGGFFGEIWGDNWTLNGSDVFIDEDSIDAIASTYYRGYIIGQMNGDGGEINLSGISTGTDDNSNLYIARSQVNNLNTKYNISKSEITTNNP